jgi:hypothetical protein
MKFRFVFWLLSLFVLSAGVAAQEGHPYEGTWRGTIGSGATARAVVIIMDYDGENISGMINPGRSSFRFEKAIHDAPNWKLSASTRTRDGVAVSFSAVMREIGSVNRYMEGTWTEDGQDYAFKITRE